MNPMPKFNFFPLKTKYYKQMKNILFLIALLFLMSSCQSNSNTAQTTKGTNEHNENKLNLTAEQIKNAGVKIGQIEMKAIASTIKANGRIDVPPQNMVSVSMPLGGYLKTTKLLPGMHVTKGEIIASMEDQQYIQLQQEYLTTKSKLQYYATEFERQKELNMSKAASDKILQQVEMEYTNQKITLKSLAEKLKLINIIPEKLTENNISKTINVYSPINGYVSKVNANIGKYLNPTDILFELVNPEDIHLNLMIFEKDLDQLFVGQKLMAFTNNNPKLMHPCSIILISKDINTERYAEVHCHFEDYDKNLFPGMYMNAEITLNDTQRPCLPTDAIVSFDGSHFVFVAQPNNQFEMKKVILGSQQNGFVHIENDSTLANQKIVTVGAYNLLMALKNNAEDHH